MSEKEVNPKNSSDTKPVMSSGEEPTELLLQLVWSPLETLQARGLARVFVGNGAVAIFLHKTDLVPYLGLVPTDVNYIAMYPKTVGDKKVKP